ncbi:hypothetical protein GLAREA_11197 [Glarea lozoyensis ATCC 20868]|uniref:Uncharacterized protein n=1 Tax=Glarea lozoyensis (strain ATCC 20868 / MF5171) TaxID=1116229 RepID=S3EAZ6_GLAL2|nr:uncharacterized protein GLAREA_11197 [Glarea lozoyensis ATCC 20868]EPE35498.1 hypothetical protein GLAREA_11197 [Glarea lozoyensis ATCC 20868]
MEGESSTPSRRADESDPHAQIITDGSADIAKTAANDMIEVGVVGRRPMQIIFTGPRTTIGYDHTKDAPSDEAPESMIPTQAEIEAYRILPDENHRGGHYLLLLGDVGWHTREEDGCGQDGRQETKGMAWGGLFVSCGRGQASSREAHGAYRPEKDGVQRAWDEYYSVFKMTKSMTAVVSLQKTLESRLPDLRNRPDDEGLLAFYDFTEDLTAEDAKRVVFASKAAFPGLPEFEPVVVMTLHRALKRTSLGATLPFRRLIPFLRFGHERLTADMGQEVVDAVVRDILRIVEIAYEVESVSWTASNRTTEDGVVRQLLESISFSLMEIVAYFDRENQSLREQYGGVTQHMSLKELMRKIGECGDATSMQVLQGHIFALAAEQLVTRNDNGQAQLRKLAAILKEASLA